MQVLRRRRPFFAGEAMADAHIPQLPSFGSGAESGPERLLGLSGRKANRDGHLEAMCLESRMDSGFQARIQGNFRATPCRGTLREALNKYELYRAVA
jgi:hypothetical protein